MAKRLLHCDYSFVSEALVKGVRGRSTGSSTFPSPSASRLQLPWLAGKEKEARKRAAVSLDLGQPKKGPTKGTHCWVRHWQSAHITRANPNVLHLVPGDN